MIIIKYLKEIENLEDLLNLRVSEQIKKEDYIKVITEEYFYEGNKFDNYRIYIKCVEVWVDFKNVKIEKNEVRTEYLDKIGILDEEIVIGCLEIFQLE